MVVDPAIDIFRPDFTHEWLPEQRHTHAQHALQRVLHHRWRLIYVRSRPNADRCELLEQHFIVVWRRVRGQHGVKRLPRTERIVCPKDCNSGLVDIVAFGNTLPGFAILSLQNF